MSFQLVVVALLAATAAAAAEKSVETLSSCTNNMCKDGCTKKTYPVGKCQEEEGKNVFWLAEECTDTTETFNIKGYTTKQNCESKTAEKKTFSTACNAVSTKLVCNDTVVTLYVCDTKTLCDGTPGDCSTVVFKKEGTDAEKCQSALGKYLKPPSTAFNGEGTCGGATVKFEEYDDAACGTRTMKNAEEVTKDVMKDCTARTDFFYTATCTKDGFKEKTTCTNNACTADCTGETTLPLGKYKQVGSSYWYLEKCPTSGDISVDTYDNDKFKTFKKMCTQEGTKTTYASATCVSASTNNTNATGGSTANTNNTNESTTTDDGATARSMAPVGVFALVMLAYAL